MSENRNAKRRRANDDNEGLAADEVPSAPAVVSSNGADNPVPLTVPNLGEIPKLVMDILNEDEDEAYNALDTLDDLMDSENPNSVANRMEAFSCGAYLAVVQTMRKWQRNRYVQSRGCCCLQNMACKKQEAKLL